MSVVPQRDGQIDGRKNNCFNGDKSCFSFFTCVVFGCFENCLHRCCRVDWRNFKTTPKTVDRLAAIRCYALFSFALALVVVFIRGLTGL